METWVPEAGSYIRVTEHFPIAEARGLVRQIKLRTKTLQHGIYELVLDEPLPCFSLCMVFMDVLNPEPLYEPWIPVEGERVRWQGHNVLVMAIPDKNRQFFRVQFLNAHPKAEPYYSPLRDLHPLPESSPKVQLETELEPLTVTVKPCPICECGDDYDKMPALEPDDCHPGTCYAACYLVKDQIEAGGSDGPYWRKQALRKVEQELKDQALRTAQAQGAAASAINHKPPPEPEKRDRWDWDPDDSLIT